LRRGRTVSESARAGDSFWRDCSGGDAKKWLIAVCVDVSKITATSQYVCGGGRERERERRILEARDGKRERE